MARNNRVVAASVAARWREVEYANPRDKDRKRERDRSRYILLLHGIDSFNVGKVNTTHLPHLTTASINPGEGPPLPSAACYRARTGGQTESLREGAAGSLHEPRQ